MGAYTQTISLASRWSSVLMPWTFPCSDPASNHEGKDSCQCQRRSYHFPASSISRAPHSSQDKVRFLIRVDTQTFPFLSMPAEGRSPLSGLFIAHILSISMHPGPEPLLVCASAVSSHLANLLCLLPKTDFLLHASR